MQDGYREVQSMNRSRWFFFPVAMISALVAPLAGITADEETTPPKRAVYEKCLRDILGEHDGEIKEVREEYITFLDRSLREVRRAGDLAGARKIATERNRFADDGSVHGTPVEDLPASVRAEQENYTERILLFNRDRCTKVVSLAEKYLLYLDSQKQEYASRGALEEAVVAQKEINRVEQSAALTGARALLKKYEVRRDRATKPVREPESATARQPVAVPAVYRRRTASMRSKSLRTYQAPRETDETVLRALRWLKMEQEEDGAWTGAGTPGITGLALLAFLGHGETPESDEFGETVRKAIDWLLTNQRRDGRFKDSDSGGYSLPIAAYALCEAYGMTRMPELKEPTERVITIIIEGQHPSGGWDYNCKKSDRDDTSYMSWCVQAVHAAKDAGIQAEGLDACLRRAVTGFRTNAHPDGGFGYCRPGKGPLTAAGVLCLQLLGRTDSREVTQGLALLAERMSCDWDHPWLPQPLYYWYYTTYAHFNAGGRHWRQWQRQFAREIIDHQTVLKRKAGGRNVGSWRGISNAEMEHGEVYSTALCTLILEVYYRYATHGEDEEIDGNR